MFQVNVMFFLSKAEAGGHYCTCICIYLDREIISLIIRFLSGKSQGIFKTDVLATILIA